MATYVRQSSFSDGDTITAALFNNEFNQLVNAFNVSTGHTHDGSTTGDGGPLSTLYSNALSFGTGADTDIVITFNANSNDGVLTWMEDEDYFKFSDDLLINSTEKVQFRDTAIYIYSSADGQLDLVADTEIQIAATTIDMNGAADISGNLGVGGNLTVTGNATISGNLTFGDAASDTVAFSADVASHLLPSADATYDLGASGSEWNNLYIDGTANIDSLVADTADINGGTIDGVTLGTNSAITQAVIDDIDLNGKVITMTGSSGDTATLTVGTNGTLAITTVDTAAAAANMTLTADGTFEAVGSTITLDSGGAINLEPAVGSAILLDGTISVDAGVVTGATSVTSTAFVGALTGNVTGNTSGTAATVTTAAQSNITSLGTLTALTVDNLGVNGNTITANSGALNLTPATGSAIVLDGTINVDAGVVTGATSVTSTAFVGALTGNVTGNTSGTALTVTQAAQTAITSVGTLTALAVDNITINGNDISSTAGTDLTITPLSGQQIVLDGTIVVDAGVVTGATSVTSTAFVGDLTGDVTGTSSKATVTDSTANTNFPVVFHNESDGLLDDTGALRYNPSTGELLVPKLTVAGTTTTADTVTMQAANAVIFEGATADAYETTLSIVDPTADHTQYLINQGGYIPLLAASTTTAITSTPAELNILDGVTSTAAELNYLDITTLGTSQASKAVTADSSGDILLPDGDKLKFGAGSDLQIYHDGSNSYIDDAGTGGLILRADNAIYLRSTDNENMVYAEKDGGVNLYFNNAAKLSTVTGGINITGDTDTDTLTVSGNATVGGTLGVTGVLTTTAATVFNGGFASNAASTVSTADNTDTLQLISTDADANSGPNLRLYRNSSSAADNDALGFIQFEGKNDNASPQDVIYADIKSYIEDASDGSEDGAMYINTMLAGTLRNTVSLLPAEVVINDEGQDVDFRVESNVSAHGLFLQASDGNVGIGGAPADPQGFGRAVHIEGATNSALYLRDTGNANYGYIGFIGGATNKMTLNSYQGYLSLTTGAGIEGVRISETGVTNIGMTAATGAATVRIGSVGDASANGTGNLQFVNSNSYKSWQISAGGTPEGDLAFTQSSANGGSTFNDEAMRITSSGGLTVTPAAGGHAVFNEGSVDADFRVESNGNANMIFLDGGNDCVGIGNSTPGSYYGNSNQLVVGSGAARQGMTIASSTTTIGQIAFADGTSGDSRYEGSIVYDHNDNHMSIATNHATAIYIDSAQQVGIGITTPNEGGFGATSSVLSVAGAAQDDFGVLELISTDVTSSNRIGEIRFGNLDAGSSFASNAGMRATRDGADNSSALSLWTTEAGTFAEKLRIDGDGQLKLTGGVTAGRQDVLFNNSAMTLADDTAYTMSGILNTGALVAIGQNRSNAGVTYDHLLVFAETGTAATFVANPSGRFGASSGTDTITNVYVSGGDLIIENKVGVAVNYTVAAFIFQGN